MFANPPRLAVIGGGPAGLMAAETAARGGAAVTVFDHMPSPGRKLLMAGRGGLNLTHAEPFDDFVARYGDAAPALAPALRLFPPEALIDWCHALNQPTFVGSSRRVFPVAMKASPLLRAWLRALASLGVRIAPRHAWIGWRDADPLFATDAGELAVKADATVLALGGASWPRLGSDGAWTARMGDVAIAPLRPSNCGFRVAWSERLRARFAGAPLKRVGLRFGEQMVRGEAVLTASGIEGGAVYALSPALREAIATAGSAVLTIDLRPDLDAAELRRRLAAPRASQSLSTFLRKTAGLPPVAVALVQEAVHREGARSDDLAALVKAVPVTLLAASPIERAISTAGGIAWDELDARQMLRRRPGVFAAGEMLDWEAPTGGYLLQACFATGAAAGRGALAWLGEPRT